MSDQPEAATPADVVPVKAGWKMPRYKAGVVEYWFTEAMTQFINGFIAGWKNGVGTGAGTGLITGANAEVANNLTAWQQILISAGTILVAMIWSGITQVSRWHETNPVPNPYPQPTGLTPSIFPKP